MSAGGYSLLASSVDNENLKYSTNTRLGESQDTAHHQQQDNKYKVNNNSQTKYSINKEEDEYYEDGRKEFNLNDSGGDLIFSNEFGDSATQEEDAIDNIPSGYKGILFYFKLSSYWFSTSAVMGGLISIVWPKQIEVLVGNLEKAKYMGSLPVLGALTSVIVGPVAGYLSDHCKSRFGKRRVFIASGTIVALVFLFLIGLVKQGYDIKVFMFYLVGLQFGINWGTTPYNGLFSDVIPKSKYGKASGSLAFANALGQLVGVVGAGLSLTFTNSFIITYGMLMVILAIPTIPTVLFIKETPIVSSPPVSLKRFITSFYLPKSLYRDFYFVIITRFFQEMGIYSILPFFQYYLVDIIHVSSEDSILYSSGVLAIIIITSVPSGILGGPLSDKYGRKLLVYISCGIMTSVILGFILLSFKPSLTIVMIFSALFGIGYGSYQGVDYALALDVLPPNGAVAKDMSIWHQSLIVPQVFAPLITGLVIDHFKTSNIILGYSCAFGIAVIWLFLSTVLIKPIKLTKHNGNINNNETNKNKFIKLRTPVDL
ncbi:hypothetical protein DICPUDRAFT_27070 [Dictyostelium purpureum]|uniref:Major facilitator superfamily (MFS) profile domain-containing protein n=1 Tax=Dictyostelium purpureum TaxID=5786 RepID=F0Z9Q2_DICPU|nr:uncharacterized protein DICPUDRAFT_27070 [Dictyostelium purpureum]EGC39341.1 hypothetical protein DICPUDRAFT_27070 [Dictyostelium purpureum]|eukprot:XP_003284129.1 hypothetical protein DICPUDRAFT_27070 [Dictyostelium purpureum]